MLIPGFGLSSSSALKAVQHERRNHRSANELAERRLEMTIQNMRINHAAVSATHCCGLWGRDTLAAPGTGGGLPALR